MGVFCLTVSPCVTICQSLCKFRVSKNFGGYPIPLPVGMYIPKSVDIELPVELSHLSLNLSWQGIFLLLEWILTLQSALSCEQYFSVLLWKSFISVYLPHLVFTFNSTSTTSLHIWHTKYPLKSQDTFNHSFILILK